MKNIKTIMVVFALLIVPVISVLGSSIVDIEQKNIIEDYNSASIQNQDDIIVTISKAPGFIGYNLDITNEGTEILEDVQYTMRTKAAITGTGILINELIQEGTIDSIQPDETITIQFRPLNQETRSPLGLGNLYMDVYVEFDDTVVRTQQRSILLLFFLIGYKDTYMDIPPDVAYEKYLAEEFDLIIDVVGLDIYQIGHLPGAVNYVWADGTLQEMIPTLDTEGTYLVYCHTDPPSTASAQALVDAGIMNTYRLEGNYAAWRDAGYPIET